MDLLTTICRLIHLKAEGDYWDFKQCYHVNKAELLHDILCLANNRSYRTGYLILGVSDNPKGEIIGVESDINRKNQQQIIDFIIHLNWAFDIYPNIQLNTFRVEDHEIDVISIKSTNDVPYFLVKDYTDKTVKNKTVCANHIYTRVQDTNTPIDKNAHPYQIEALWKHRFGLDLQPLERVQQMLLHPHDWNKYSDDLDNTIYYNKFSPEYTICCRYADDKGEPPFYAYYQMDERTLFKDVDIKYHSTTLAKIQAITLNNGCFTCSIPDIAFVHNKSQYNKPIYSFRYQIVDSIQYNLSRFFYNSNDLEENYAKQMFDSLILYFVSEEDKAKFIDYLEDNLGLLKEKLTRIETPSINTGNILQDREYSSRIQVSLLFKQIQKEAQYLQQEKI